MEVGLCQDERDFINFIEESITKIRGKGCLLLLIMMRSYVRLMITGQSECIVGNPAR